MESVERWEIRLQGRVQGVAYRASARQKARELGLAGWVRNEADGGVTVVAEGDPALLGALEAWCRQGPPLARVDRCRVVPLTDRSPLPLPFEVRR